MHFSDKCSTYYSNQLRGFLNELSSGELSTDTPKTHQLPSPPITLVCEEPAEQGLSMAQQPLPCNRSTDLIKKKYPGQGIFETV